MPSRDPELQRVYDGRSVCVTGGAGFVGSHLCEALVDHGAEVSIIDDLSSGSMENIEPIAARVRFVEASILDPQALADATRSAEVVFHQAALTSVPGSVEQPVHYHEVNATGTLQVLEAARQAGRAVRVVYASSSSVYGDREEMPLVETMTPLPASPYAAAKCAGEQFLRAYTRCYGLSGVSLRYFNLFGPRQRPDSPYAAVIPRFAQAIAEGRRPTVYGDGRQTRDFTHVANAVSANLLAGASPKPLAGEVVNIACGHSISVLELLTTMARALDVAPDHETAPPRVGDVLHSRASIDWARQLLGYAPLVDLDGGLRDALAYYAASGRV